MIGFMKDYEFISSSLQGLEWRSNRRTSYKSGGHTFQRVQSLVPGARKGSARAYHEPRPFLHDQASSKGQHKGAGTLILEKSRRQNNPGTLSSKQREQLIVLP